MKKIFKALAITATAAAMCVGIGAAAGCANTEETYVGEYHYIGSHTAYTTYGIVVEVTVKNNVITKIKDITNTEAAKSYQTYKDVIDGKEVEGDATYHEFTTVSPGWGDYSASMGMGGMDQPAWYGWSNDDASNWTDHVSWLCDQYIGVSVADVLDLSVYTDYGYSIISKDAEGNPILDEYTQQPTLGVQVNKDLKGEPYKVAFNADLADYNNGQLLITGATQGSGRFLLAVQDALTK